MLLRNSILVVFIPLALSVGCHSSKAGGAATGPATSGSAAAAPRQGAKAVPHRVAVPALGISVEAPEGTKVTEIMKGMEQVRGPGLVINLDVDDSHADKTLDQAKKGAQVTKPTNMKGETLSDGWVLTYEGDNGGKRGFFVEGRREIGGKAIGCDSATESAAQQQATAKACRSIKPM